MQNLTLTFEDLSCYAEVTPSKSSKKSSSKTRDKEAQKSGQSNGSYLTESSENSGTNLRNDSSNTKQILHNLNGILESKDLVAIIGPSGAGKSTFLNCLAYRNLSGLKLTGQVMVNNHNYKNNINKFSEYVQQEDLLLPDLTVEQHLKFHAALKSGLAEDSINQQIDSVLEEVNLTNSKSTSIKFLSGGEKKRLSFATKILQRPKILFCDEPTSGLDTNLAHTVVKSLKNISQKGTIILCTIHQPSSKVFDLFDKIILMQEGKILYFGEKEQAKLYFQNECNLPCPANYNPADHYIEILSDSEDKNLVKIYENSQNFKDLKDGMEKAKQAFSKGEEGMIKVEKSYQKPPILKQIYWLLWRDLILQLRNYYEIFTKTVIITYIAITFALIYLRALK